MPDLSGALDHGHLGKALAGLLLAAFVGSLSATLVTNALPSMVLALDGGNGQYGWIMASSILAASASAPIWGKLADLVGRKRLIQASLALFVLGSAACGLAPDAGVLIGLRVVQGLGAGGLIGLPHILMASLVSSRDRGNYMGYFAVAGAGATLLGPPLSGLIVDSSFLGWRWCFWITVPVGILAIGLVQHSVRINERRGRVSVDWLGALSISVGICLLLLWTTFGGKWFSWISWQSIGMAVGGLGSLLLAVAVERRAKEPVFAPGLVCRRNVGLVVLANFPIGVAVIASVVFIVQYFQLGRGYSATQSGLLVSPLMVGMILGSFLCGRWVSRYGRWKSVLVVSCVAVVGGLLLLGMVDERSSLILICLYLLILGFGLGGSMPNSILVVQNEVGYGELGSGTSVVLFVRSLGSAVGVASFGAVVAGHVNGRITRSLDEDGVNASRPPNSFDAEVLTDVNVQALYSEATALVFQISAALAAVAVVAVIFIREKPLKTRVE